MEEPLLLILLSMKFIVQVVKKIYSNPNILGLEFEYIACIKEGSIWEILLND